jgi:crossover junction endodeoxyribonuclease RuvC
MQNSSTVFLGIDPGKTGAIAFLFPDFAEVLDTPRDEATGAIDPIEMARIVGGVTSFDKTVIATIERAQAYPKQGVASCFNYGVGYGMWIGVLAAFRVTLFLRVSPSVWKKDMLGDVDRSDKYESIKLARSLFPDVDLGKKKDAGRAEALLIGEYGRRQYYANDGEARF